MDEVNTDMDGRSQHRRWHALIEKVLTKEANDIVFTITPRALAVMRTIAEHRTMASTSGLRIAHRQDPSAPMEVKAVQGPRPGDGVVTRDGARLYLGPDAETRIDGGELDAVTDERGRVQFVLRAAA